MVLYTNQKFICGEKKKDQQKNYKEKKGIKNKKTTAKYIKI